MTLHLSGLVEDRAVSWPLDQPTIGIGRSSRHGIQIADATVSKDHAEITLEGERVRIRDLGSRNGTRVNGLDAREPLALKVGDRVEIGHVLLQVTAGTPPSGFRFNESSEMSSSLRLRAPQVIEKRARTGSTDDAMLHLIAEAGQLLVLPRPLQETCDEIVRFVERAIPASRHVLLLRNGPGDELVQMAARARGNAASQPLALSRSILRTVLEDCTSVLTGDALEDPRFMQQQSIVAQRVHSAMAVPLFDNENVLGLIYVDSQDVRVTFAQDRLEVLTLLANMAAVKITNARLLEHEAARARMEQELATAARIQRGLLPLAAPVVPGWEIDAYLQTCYEVGGDLYDFHRRADGKLVFVLGDVSGKGMGASLLMSSFLASARVLYDTIPDLAELARRLCNIVNRSTEDGHFVTGFVGCLDPTTGTLEYVNAGHPAPCLVRGGELRELESTGVPFGILPEFPYASATVQIEPGTLLTVFSDGVPEAQSGQEFYDNERLHLALKASAPLVPLEAARLALIRNVEEFLAGAPRSDDVTVLMLRRAAGAA